MCFNLEELRERRGGSDSVLVVASERVAVDGRLVGVRGHVHRRKHLRVLHGIRRAGFPGRPVDIVDGNSVALNAKVLGGHLGELLAARIVPEKTELNEQTRTRLLTRGVWTLTCSRTRSCPR